MSFEASADGTPDPEGILCEGEPTGVVIAECACGHSWRLRGVSQITDLRPEGNGVIEDAP